MRPIQLQLQNFLSYGSDVPPLRFDGMHVVCLSGPNGHGKSALLDAITWALWGKSRARSDDDLIHYGRQHMLVDFEFLLEDQRYRVRRERVIRGRTRRSGLEFFVWDPSKETWRPLTGPTIRETQRHIIDLLRLDYETFINSAYLKQGRADEFTVKTPGERKRILAEILHLDRYTELERRAREHMRHAEQQVQILIHQREAVEAEIAQEERYREELQAAEAFLADLVRQREAAQARENELQTLVETLKQLEETARRQTRRVRELQEEIRSLEQRVAGLHKRLEDARDRLARREEIEQRRREYLRLQEENARWNEILQQQAVLQDRLQKAESALHEARLRIERQLAQMAQSAHELRQRAARKEAAIRRMTEAEAQLQRLAEVETQYNALRDQVTRWKEERATLEQTLKQLKQDMQDLKERMNRLEDAREEPECPLCGQPLTEEHVMAMLSQLHEQGAAMRQAYDSARARLNEVNASLAQAQNDLKQMEKTLAEKSRWQSQFARAERDRDEAEEAARQLTEVEKEHARLAAELESGAFAADLAQEVQHVRAQLAALGYDAQAHEEIREALKALSSVEEEYRALLLAEQEVGNLESQIQDLDSQIKRRRETLAEEEAHLEEINERVRKLPEAEQQLRAQTREVDRLTRQERDAHTRVGGLRQQLAAIEAQKKRLAILEKDIQRHREMVGIFGDLVQAFGKNGLQAMIIEAALPEIEEEANRLLARMTGGRMTVRLKTQRELRSGDAAETLDIEIADDMGVRPYEMYSGGEAFRINFALRIALSKLLARRAGASLRSLFIDEGFGSQDSEGRLRLVEAINSIQDEFDLIVVITHIEELKEAFPVRVEVFKGPNGSTFTIT